MFVFTTKDKNNNRQIVFAPHPIFKNDVNSHVVIKIWMTIWIKRWKRWKENLTEGRELQGGERRSLCGQLASSAQSSLVRRPEFQWDQCDSVRNRCRCPRPVPRQLPPAASTPDRSVYFRRYVFSIICCFFLHVHFINVKITHFSNIKQRQIRSHNSLSCRIKIYNVATFGKA